MKKETPKPDLKKNTRIYNLATRMERRSVNGKENEPKSR